MTRFKRLAIIVTLVAIALRVVVAFGVAVDSSGDGPIYQQIARNVVQHGVYSAATQAPYEPTFIRMPGYPLVVAAVFATFGNGNVTALHAVQVVADMCTCWLVLLLALRWAPRSWDATRRDGAALAAFALYAVCPFTMAYIGTALAETWAVMLCTLSVWCATWAMGADDAGMRRWALAGFVAGISCLFRPELGLLLAVLGLMILTQRRASWPVTFGRGAVCAGAFAVALLPWTVRNGMVFRRFQPLPEVHASMPNEFVPIGYLHWVRSWITQPEQVEDFLWPLDDRAMNASKLPAKAFDAPTDVAHVRALFDTYNRAVRADTSAEDSPTARLPFAPGNANASAMSPTLDAEFGVLARARGTAHPLRQYLLLPATRAWNLWFDSHSIYYPFSAYTAPWTWPSEDEQGGWLLRVFYTGVWLYTLLAVWGMRQLWRDGAGRRWVLLATLLFVPRLAFLALSEVVEPRYMVELFPIVAVLGGLALASLVRRVPGAISAGADLTPVGGGY